MCVSAIRWANFREYVYGTSIDFLVKRGWGQFRISSGEVWKKSFDLPGGMDTMMMGEVLIGEMDPLFAWQYDGEYECPDDCAKDYEELSCIAL